MGIKCYLCMPIVFGRKPVGTLNIASYNKNAFDKEELMLLSIVAQQIGVAIKNASRAEALRKSELALQKANEELEDRVIERTKALSKANLALRGEIRKRRGAEEQIKSALKEKEVLLKEIQHRVKNNLQVIKSLIDLQSQFGENEDLKTILDETQTRIVAIALIHDLLYRSGNLRKIDFSEYSKNLTDYLFVSYGVNAKSIRLNINIGNNDMSVEIATICGMILNELVSNSLKHAFRNGGKGEIFISLRPEKNSYILIVRDNGIGFPKGLNFRKTKTLGMQLVMSLVNQLDGSIKLRRINGTEFRIAFPDN
jgi:two-component system, sensor histidine kinase PdtaS